MNEAETRAEHIDAARKAAGWGVVEGSRIRREYPITLGEEIGNVFAGFQKCLYQEAA
jgi:type I restriction enzyme R subunit